MKLPPELLREIETEAGLRGVAAEVAAQAARLEATGLPREAKEIVRRTMAAYHLLLARSETLVLGLRMDEASAKLASELVLQFISEDCKIGLAETAAAVAS